MRWVPPRGGLGAATGAIAIGTTATSTSTTTITTIRTPTGTLTVVKPGRATSGSTIRNIAEMHRMVTEERRTSSVVRVPVEPEIGEVPAELDARAALVALAA